MKRPLDGKLYMKVINYTNNKPDFIQLSGVLVQQEIKLGQHMQIHPICVVLFIYC